MNANNGNGNRPKVEIALNEEATLTLTRDKAHTGQSSWGTYYLYGVNHNGEDKSFFATEEVHQKILEAGLRTGDQFVIRKKAIQNGRKVTAKVEFEVVSKQPPPADGNGDGRTTSDGLKEVLLQCVRDADFIMKNAEAQISDEVQKLATTLFIARTRMT